MLSSGVCWLLSTRGCLPGCPKGCCQLGMQGARLLQLFWQQSFVPSMALPKINHVFTLSEGRALEIFHSTCKTG